MQAQTPLKQLEMHDVYIGKLGFSRYITSYEPMFMLSVVI